MLQRDLWQAALITHLAHLSLQEHWDSYAAHAPQGSQKRNCRRRGSCPLVALPEDIFRIGAAAQLPITRERQCHKLSRQRPDSHSHSHEATPIVSP